MYVLKNRVISLDVELFDIWGNLIEHPPEPVQYLHGEYGDIFPVVEAALDGKSAKDRVDLRLEPEDAYGDYNADLLHVESLATFPQGLEVGMRVERVVESRIDVDAEADAMTEAETMTEAEPKTEARTALYTITDIADGKVVLDGNHPLAGMALRFLATIVDVRPATLDEIENGAADDPSSVVMRALP